MIISASRRTDIPAFYASWLFNRIKEQYVLVRNPYNPKMISRIDLNPASVDCMVFWTKNAAPMLNRLDRLNAYKYYFQFTVNAYGQELEPGLPPLVQRLETFKRLADAVGKERVIWRYDPILINEKYDIHFHQQQFAAIAHALDGYTEMCMLGFIDHYRHIRTVLARHHIEPLVREDIETMASAFKSVLHSSSVQLTTCTSKVDLSPLGIPAGRCIDDRLIERITGHAISARKDKNQRALCQCVQSVDIGAYNTCLNGCLYCYANRSALTGIQSVARLHDPQSPLLIGQLSGEDIVKRKKDNS